MASNRNFRTRWHLAGSHSSDSSVPSYDYSHRVKRTDRSRWLTRFGSPIHTSSESLESLYQQCRKQESLAKLAVTQTRTRSRSSRSVERRPKSGMRRAIRYIWATEVISGTGFYALTEQDWRDAAEIRTTLAAQLGESPNMAEHVEPWMVCALKVDGSWERVLVKSHCSMSGCLLRKGGEEQLSPQEYWHVSLMEMGTRMCVPVSQLALVTRDIASQPHKAKLYYLRRIYLDNDKKAAEAKEYLKSKIMNNQQLTAEVFYPWSGGKPHAEVVIGNKFLSDALVEAGFASYYIFGSHGQGRKASDESALCSAQDIVSARSIDSLVSHVPQLPPQNANPDAVHRSMPELMELIDHLMKTRKEIAYLTSSGSALNFAIKIMMKDRAFQCQGRGEHGFASLNKNQILLRKLRDENPRVSELRGLKEPLYEQIVEMFEKWKASYREARKKSETAIDNIANIFLSFTNGNYGHTKYKQKCQRLETSVSNEVLLQIEGQDLMPLIASAVVTKVMHSIEKLEIPARGLPHATQKPLTLHQFVTTSKNITPLTLEALAKDILNGLYHYHVKGMAYKHLHPENVLVLDGHAVLRPIDNQQECTIGENWPFEGVEVPNEDLGRPGDVFNFGLLVLWMACMGADDYNTVDMKCYCNMALIKMAMAADPNQRPLVESMVCINAPIFRSNIHWRSMPLRDYLEEVFSDQGNAEVKEDNPDQLPEIEVGESTSELECIYQSRTEESGNETTDSETFRSPPSYVPGMEGKGKAAAPLTTPEKEA